MAKNKHSESIVDNRECPRLEGCEIRLGIAATKARVVSLIHLGARAFYTCIGWFVLGKAESASLFASLFLFVFPILMDCIYYGFLGRSRRLVIITETLVSIAWAMVSILGLLGVLVINDTNLIMFADNFTVIPGITISMQHLWLFLGSIPFITCVDFSSRFSMKDDFKKVNTKGE